MRRCLCTRPDRKTSLSTRWDFTTSAIPAGQGAEARQRQGVRGAGMASVTASGPVPAERPSKAGRLGWSGGEHVRGSGTGTARCSASRQRLPSARTSSVGGTSTRPSWPGRCGCAVGRHRGRRPLMLWARGRARSPKPAVAVDRRKAWRLTRDYTSSHPRWPAPAARPAQLDHPGPQHQIPRRIAYSRQSTDDPLLVCSRW